jgi:UDP-N-acetylmuramyl pentapeptide phosphotransferase/UDP-N-acetylglucosamine-1-phosphate transferase
MSSTNLLALFVMVHVSALAGSGLAFMILSWMSIFDRPNPRSSHASPTPRGAGLAITPVAAAAVAGLGWYAAGAPAFAPAVAGLALALGAVSWIDDRRGLPAGLRLTAHAIAIAAALYLMRDVGPYFGGWLPPWLDLCAAGVLWLWFVNLYNFMDGIDGITGTETAVVGIGITAVAVAAGLGGALPAIGFALAAAASGFLWWNFPPAKVFLGDVGSVPLGFLVGWALLLLAAQGQMAAAMILPLYYLADATWTLGRRILKRERFWEAHRQHFYQRAARGRWGHGRVVLAVLAADGALVVLAVVAAKGWAIPALVAAAAVVATLLRALGRAGSWR